MRADADLDYTTAELVDGRWGRFRTWFLSHEHSKAPFSTLAKAVVP